MNEYQKNLAKRNAIAEMEKREEIRCKFHDALTEYLTLLYKGPGTYNFVVHITFNNDGDPFFNVPYLQKLGNPEEEG